MLDFVEWAVIGSLLVVNLLLTLSILAALGRVWTALAPLLEKAEKMLGKFGGEGKMSINDLLGYAGKKAVDTLDFGKLLGGLGGK